MSGTNLSRAKTKQRGPITDDRDLRTLSKASGVPVAQLCKSMAEAREQLAKDRDQDKRERAAGIMESVRFNVAEIASCISDAEDMANALRHGDCGRIAPESVAHGIFAICERTVEFLSDLRADLEIED